MEQARGPALKPIFRPSPNNGIHKEYSEGVTVSNQRNRAERTDAAVSQAKQALVPAEGDRVMQKKFSLTLVITLLLVIVAAAQDFKILQPLASQPTKITDPDLREQVLYIPNVLEYVRWGILPNAETKAIATVKSGDVVVYDIISHEGLLEDQGRDPVKFFARYGVPPDQVLDDAKAVAASDIPHLFFYYGPHIISPPLGIEGAQPGDVLKIDILKLQPRVPYGVNAIRHGKGAEPSVFPVTPSVAPDANAKDPDSYHSAFFLVRIKRVGDKWQGYMHSDRGGDIPLPIQPMIGTIGVAPNTTKLLSSVPPGAYGGNIDLPEMGEGTTLYLPVQVPGAQFYVADSHFGQGNGEVSLTAIEASLRATLRLTLLKKGDSQIPIPGLKGPFAETKDYWIPLGFSDRLDDAMTSALQQSLDFLQARFQITADESMAYLSMGANFDVGEVVDITKQIYCLIPKSAFANVPSANPKAANHTSQMRLPLK